MHANIQLYNIASYLAAVEKEWWQIYYCINKCTGFEWTFKGSIRALNLAFDINNTLSVRRKQNFYS